MTTLKEKILKKKEELRKEVICPCGDKMVYDWERETRCLKYRREVEKLEKIYSDVVHQLMEKPTKRFKEYEEERMKLFKFHNIGGSSTHLAIWDFITNDLGL